MNSPETARDQKSQQYCFTTIKVLILILLLSPCYLSHAQDNKTMRNYETNLIELFDLAFTSKTDNERFNANEQATLVLEEALAQPESFLYRWDSLKRVSILKSDDNKFKIFTWAIIRDNGEYDCFGYIQALNEKTDEYDVTVLADKTQEIFNAEEASLNENNWYGAVYYSLITSKYEKRTYYTLLGWTGKDYVSQKKIIEPIYFKSNSSKPTFGQNVFYKDKNRRRVIFEYSKDAVMMLRYDKQSYTITEKGKNRTKIETTEQDNMIIFDILQPMVAGMDGIYQYYIPSGDENAYVFIDGRWRLQTNIETGFHLKKYDDYKRNLKPKAPIYQPKIKSAK